MTDGSRPAEPVFVALSGGLGNQLFQLAAGLFVAGGAPVVLESGFLSPRQWLPGRPDVAGFRLPSSVSLLAPGSTERPGRAARLGVRFAMRSGLVPGRWDARPAVRRAAARISGRLTARHLGCRCAVVGASGHGYDPALETVRSPLLLVGYFQTWRYAAAADVLPVLLRLSAHSEDPWIIEMQELAEGERPLVVHVRLGDYRHDDDFGIPGSEYYSQAFNRFTAGRDYGRIWLFSDEPENALERMPMEIQTASPRLIKAPESVDPAGLLAVMRCGRGFILTNSTFGYWAALLSGCAEDLVSIPDPWFSGLSPFVDFAPSGWLRLPGAHRS